MNDSDCISFYTAECSEFPVMGECHTGLTLEDAFTKYDQIPGERMNGVKCIGFDLQDGSEWSGMFPLVTGNSIDKELINSIRDFVTISWFRQLWSGLKNFWKKEVMKRMYRKRERKNKGGMKRQKRKEGGI